MIQGSYFEERIEYNGSMWPSVYGRIVTKIQLYPDGTREGVDITVYAVDWNTQEEYITFFGSFELDENGNTISIVGNKYDVDGFLLAESNEEWSYDDDGNILTHLQEVNDILYNTFYENSLEYDSNGNTLLDLEEHDYGNDGSINHMVREETAYDENGIALYYYVKEDGTEGSDANGIADYTFLGSIEYDENGNEIFSTKKKMELVHAQKLMGYMIIVNIGNIPMMKIVIWSHLNSIEEAIVILVVPMVIRI